MKQVYKLTFNDGGYLQRDDTIQQEKSDERFEAYEGKVIRNIRYKVQDVVGPDVDDTSKVSLPGFYSWLNNLHPKTRNYVVKNNQLFKENEKLNPLELANSERLLRDLASIKDARIYVSQVENQPDSVDITIVVKDKFPIGARLDVPSSDHYNLSVYTVNFMGWGHLFDNTVSVLPGHAPLLRYSRMQYSLPNIAGTFIKGEGILQWEDDTWLKKFQAQKVYEPLKPSWGGLAKIEENRYNRVDVVIDPHDPDHDSLTELPITYNEKNLAVGYSFMFDKEDVLAPEFMVILPAYISRQYLERPHIAEDTNFQYQHRTNLLFSITFLRNDFYRSRYINNFGITEDVPYGMNITLTMGYELGELTDRSYGGASVSAGNYTGNLGYFYSKVEAGSFVRNRKFNQGLVNLEFSYFSKLFSTPGQYRSRLSFSTYYAIGFNRYGGERLYILDDYALKGLDTDFLYGNQRLNFIAKLTTFTPWYFYGFRFAVELFADLGFIGSNTESIFNNTLYSGLGIGFKIRNESLVFRTIELSLIWHPILPEGQGDRFHLGARSVPTSRFADFQATNPYIIPYKYYYYE
ncbi:MAG: hypothetical protein ACLFPE_00225 [Bacteroidales bacterium]